MERQEKILRLSERMKVSLEEAARALDEAGGDLLDAALLLERDKDAGERVVHIHSTAANAVAATAAAASQEAAKGPSTEKKVKEILGAMIEGLFTHPILNGVVLEYKGKRLAVIPAGILLALLLVRWWILPGLTAVGLLVGWKFTWSGPQWGNAALNEVWGTLENTVERWREKMKSDRPHG